MDEKRKTQIIPASAELRQKAVNFRRGVSMKLSKKDIRRIEQAIEKSSDTFATQALTTLRLLRQNIAAAADEARDRPGFIDLARRAALDMKGLGGTFGYPLLSAISGSLHDYTRDRVGADDTQMAIIRLHIDMLYLVVHGKIVGDGGTQEAELVEAFRAATRKFA